MPGVQGHRQAAQHRGALPAGRHLRSVRWLGQVPRSRARPAMAPGMWSGRSASRSRIPKGVYEGAKVRVAGQGSPGLGGGPPGDCCCTCGMLRNPMFERKEDDLYVDLPVTFAEAALGAEVQVPTITGKVTATLPPGTQSGQSLRLTGLGMPHLRGGGSGNLYARIKVAVPRNLSDEERDLIRQLGGIRRDNPRERLLAGGSAGETMAVLGKDPVYVISIAC